MAGVVLCGVVCSVRRVNGNSLALLPPGPMDAVWWAVLQLGEGGGGESGGEGEARLLAAPGSQLFQSTSTLT